MLLCHTLPVFSRSRYDNHLSYMFDMKSVVKYTISRNSCFTGTSFFSLRVLWSMKSRDQCAKLTKNHDFHKRKKKSNNSEELGSILNI